MRPANPPTQAAGHACMNLRWYADVTRIRQTRFLELTHAARHGGPHELSEHELPGSSGMFGLDRQHNEHDSSAIAVSTRPDATVLPGEC